jgi:Predicted membrane protein
MAKCTRCGTESADNVKFCPKCGLNMQAGQQQQQNNPNQNINQTIQNFNNTNDHTNQFNKADIEQNKVMAILAYFGVLFIVPLLAAPNSQYAKFHANQGLVLFISEIIVGIASSILTAIIWIIGPLVGSLLGLVIFILAVIGIINASQGNAKELPIIGGIRIIK